MSKKRYRLSILRTYLAPYVEIEASSPFEAKTKYLDKDWIETGSDRFNEEFELQYEEILEYEELK